MTFKLSKRSLDKLVGVHPDLVKVVHRAIEITKVDFAVICGLRSLEEQKILVEMGKSTTMKSRHLTGHAVDLVAFVNEKPNWEVAYYQKIQAAMSAAAWENKIPIEYGGDWMKFHDYDHWQLPKTVYPNIARAS